MNPVKPAAQSQLKSSTKSVHDPPFSQGEGKQSSISVEKEVFTRKRIVRKCQNLLLKLVSVDGVDEGTAVVFKIVVASVVEFSTYKVS